MAEKQAKYQLRLYITDRTDKAERMIKQLRNMLEEELESYELEVIDIMERPQLAEEEKILATPMLEKKLPPPVRRIVGKLSDEEKVLLGLDLVGKN